MANGEKCSRCGRTLAPEGVGTGYGVNKDGAKVCYPCCAEQDRETMLHYGDHDGLYLVSKGGRREVTNWPGSLRFWVYRHSEGKHNIGGTRHDVWFAGPDGMEWHGVNIGDNEICRCKRTKRAARVQEAR